MHTFEIVIPNKIAKEPLKQLLNSGELIDKTEIIVSSWSKFGF